MKLDYSLTSPEERKKLVEQILQETPNPNSQYLEILANYLILCMEKQEKKERKIITENRATTIDKRELSFEGLVSGFENGEDGIYNLVKNDKNIIFQPKVSITKKDLEEIPELRQVREAIEAWETILKQAVGKDAYIAKKTIIDLRKDQYMIKNAMRQPLPSSSFCNSRFPMKLESDEEIIQGRVIPHGISLCNPKICSAALCNYERLANSAYGRFNADIYYFFQDFLSLLDEALKDKPLYRRIVELKISGFQNLQIQETLREEFGATHTIEYISSLWRNKIPKLLASCAEDRYLDWHYLNQEKGTYKKCSRCGQIKLANNKYFSKNRTSKDGYYSICKACRNKKKGGTKE